MNEWEPRLLLIFHQSINQSINQSSFHQPPFPASASHHSSRSPHAHSTGEPATSTRSPTASPNHSCRVRARPWRTRRRTPAIPARAGSNAGATAAHPVRPSLFPPSYLSFTDHGSPIAHLPENTLASYRAAILEGAEGIESGTRSRILARRRNADDPSDVHATTDGVVLMFHDPTLDRTTDGKGAIKEQAWYGNIECVFVSSCLWCLWMGLLMRSSKACEDEEEARAADTAVRGAHRVDHGGQSTSVLWRVLLTDASRSRRIGMSS